MKLYHRERTIRFFYGMLFVIWWVALLYYIAGFSPAIYQSGAVSPRGEQIVLYNEHGHVVYITPMQQFLLDLYGFTILIGFAVYLMIGFVLQGAYKVKIYRTGIPWPWSKIWPWSKMVNSEENSSQDSSDKIG